MKFKKRLPVVTKDAELPATRKQLFFTVLKEDFFLPVDASVAEALASLPLVAALVAEYLFLTSARVEFASVFPVVLWMGLICALCFGVKYVFRNAAFAVMKKRAHNEACYVTAEIFAAVRENGLRSFFAGLLFGAALTACECGFVWLVFSVAAWYKWVGVGALIVASVVAFGTVEYFCAGQNFYSLSFGECLSNSVRFAFMTFPAVTLHFVFKMALVAVAAVFLPYLAVALLGLFALYGNGLSAFGATLYAHAAFDKFINSAYYPEIVKKGLRTEKEKENG